MSLALRVYEGDRHDDRQSYTLCSLTQRINSKREPTESLLKLKETSNAVLRELQNILEHWFQELHPEGVGTEHKQAEEVQSRFCGKKVYLPGKIPLGLLNVVLILFYAGDKSTVILVEVLFSGKSWQAY